MAVQFPLFVPLTLVDKFTRPLAGAAGALEGFGKKAEKVGRKLTVGLTVPLTAFGALSIKAGLDYQRSLNRVEARTAATGAEMDALRAQAEGALGAGGIPFTARRAAAAMDELAKSGQGVAEIQATLPGVIALAVAAQEDEAVAAQATADVLDTYKLAATEAGRVTDLLAFGANRGQQDLAGLAAGLVAAGQTATAFEQDLEGTAAILDVLADAGFEGSAGAALFKRGLAALAKPAGETEKTLQRLGVTSGELFRDDGQLRQFDEILATLTKRGATARDAVALFGAKAGPSLAALLGPGAARVRAFAEELRGADGAAVHLAEVALGGGIGELESFEQKWERLLVTLARSGLIEALGTLATKAGALLTVVAQLPAPVLKWGLALGAVAAALGPLLIAVGTLFQVLGPLLGVLAVVGPAIVGFLVSPIALAVLAIGALVAAGGALFVYWDQLQTKTKDAWGAITSSVGAGVDWIGQKLSALGSIVPDWLVDLLGAGTEGAPAPAGAGRAAHAREIGRSRVDAVAAAGGAGADVSGAVRVEFANAPPGTRVSARRSGDVPVDVDVGYNLAGGLAG